MHTSLPCAMSAPRSPRTHAAALILMLGALGTERVEAQAASTTAPRVTEQASGVTVLLQSAHAVSPRVAWATGRGTVIRTTNGGETWEARPVPGGDSLDFRDVHALNADTAWVLSIGNGAASRIFRTNDGGAHWTTQHVNRDTSAFFDCITMMDRNRGIVYSDAAGGRTVIMRTTNGGAQWTELDRSRVPAPLPGEGAFAASGLCVVHADSNTVFIATGAPGARLFKSTDAGASWIAINTPFVRGRVAGLTGLSFVNAQRGIAVGADINALRTDVSAGVVGVTDDGGRNWSIRSRPPLPGALAGVTWVPRVGRNVAVAAGYGGAFWTADEGRTWQTLTSDGYMGVSAAGRTVFLTGANGKIMRLDW